MMNRWKRLFLILRDHPEDTVAAAWAALLAERHKMPLTTIVVEETARLWQGRPSALASHTQISQNWKVEIDQRLSELAEKGIEVNPQPMEAGSWQDVLELLAHQHDGLVLTAESRHERLPLRWYNQSVRLLTRESPCSVWVVKQPTIHTEQRWTRGILAAVNLDDSSARNKALNASIMQAAIEVCRAEQCRLHVIHAWRFYGESMLRDSYIKRPSHEVDEMVMQAQKHKQAELGTFLRPYRTAWPNTTAYLVKDDVPAAISKMVELLGVELLVLGCSGRRGLAALIYGNTAEKLVTRVECGVLTIKMDERDAEAGFYARRFQSRSASTS